jgi:hypothetical protein
MVGMELDLALIVCQLPVKTAYGLHALPPILRKGFGSRGEGVADDPFVQLMPCLNIKNMNFNVGSTTSALPTFYSNRKASKSG